MEKNSELEETKIKTHVLKLLLRPASDLAKIMLKFSIEDRENATAIFWNVSRNMQIIPLHIPGRLVSIFPAFLETLDGDFSKERVEFIAEFLIDEVKNLQRHGVKGHTNFDDIF